MPLETRANCPGIEYVTDDPVDGRPFDIRTKRGRLASVPCRVELNDIPMMLVPHHEAAAFHDRCMDAPERLDREGGARNGRMTIRRNSGGTRA